MNCGSLVTAYTTKNPSEAEVVRLALEAAGILATLSGGRQAGLTGAVDIDVMVRAEDAAAGPGISCRAPGVSGQRSGGRTSGAGKRRKGWRRGTAWVKIEPTMIRVSHFFMMDKNLVIDAGAWG